MFMKLMAGLIEKKTPYEAFFLGLMLSDSDPKLSLTTLHLWAQVTDMDFTSVRRTMDNYVASLNTLLEEEPS